MRHGRALLAAGVAVLVVAVAAALVAPEVLRRLALRWLEARLTVPARIADVDANLATGRVRVEDLVIGGADGAPPLLAVPVLDLDVSYRALVRGASVLTSVTVHEPKLRLERRADGSLEVLQAFRPARGGGGGLSVEWLELRGGEVRLVDHAQVPRFERVVQNVRLTASDVSTLPGRVDPASFEAGLRIGDGTVTVAGSSRPFQRPVDVELTAELRGIDPAILTPYLPLPVEGAGGRLDARVRYVRDLQGSGPGAHRVIASATLGPARLAPEPGRDPAIAVRGLRVDDLRLELGTGQGRVRAVVVEAPRVRLRREADGALELGRLLGAGAAPAAGGAPGEPASRAPLALVVESARVQDGRLALEDATTTPPAGTVLHDVDLAVTGLALGAAAPTPAGVTLSARVGDAASLSASGQVQPAPLDGTVTVSVEGLPVETFDPYVNAALGVPTVRRGTLEARLDVRLARPPDGAPALSVSGRLAGRELAFGLPGVEDPLVTARGLEAELDRVTLLPALGAAVSAIRLDHPVIRLRRDQEHGLNVRRAWEVLSRARAARDGASAAPEEEAEEARDGGVPPPLRIARIDVEAGEVAYRDLTLEPALVERAVDLHLGVRDLGGPGRAPVRLAGRVGDAAPLRLDGWVAPLGDPVRFRAAGRLEGYDLSRLQPLFEALVGYRVTRGRATLEVAYEYDGRRLTGLNTLTVRHLEPGVRVNDRLQETLGLSWPAVVALLPREDGALRLRVPVSGDLSAPRVELGALIGDAIRSTLVRTVTAPFRLLGAAVVQAGRVRDLRVAPLPFQPGTVSPEPEGAGRLAALAALLGERSGLGVEIQGQAGGADVPALKVEQLDRQLAAGGRGPRAELTELYQQSGGDPSFGPVPDAVMRERVLARLALAPDALARLARARARVVERLLLDQGAGRGQLFVTEPRVSAAPQVSFQPLF
jgi:hypothetical protein